MARVLIIDDEPEVRKILRRILEHDGHEIVEASDGDEGLRYYRLQPVDLVITDILMPGEGGISTIREIRREAPDARIIAISGGGDTGRLDFLPLAKNLGAFTTLSKPILIADLRKAVAEALGAGSA